MTSKTLVLAIAKRLIQHKYDQNDGFFFFFGSFFVYSRLNLYGIATVSLSLALFRSIHFNYFTWFGSPNEHCSAATADNGISCAIILLITKIRIF